MVKTYSSSDKLPKGIESIGDIPSVFSLHFDCLEADETDRQILKTIDNAEIVDAETDLIKTPFGLCSKEYLSNGCKTALVANWMKKNGITNYAVDAISCGCNALDIIYQVLDNTGICVIQYGLPTHTCKWQGIIDYDDGKFTGKPFGLLDILLK